ncbi:PQQ-dependent sugar dehydrogenase [Paractinoplanes atraurantiacus]|uniref:Glucose/arabinose dehydrogenase, beta-propeller fold n=1 Tax=Paractinoplanes atraurantiacus TaxID=1036182 RepID=A0A285KQD3_9ACTN|nr:gluconolaconase [Actinoplanes atraurantiacus]SNY74848.1 Glucose/arabinose dehydrogenase, beta-propeller fold [Actinoplanes atraurantiacus]
MARAAVAGGLALCLVGCSSSEPPTPAPRVTQTTTPVRETGVTLTATPVRGGDGQAPFDQQRELKVPAGWTVSVYARVPSARLLAFAPDGKLLVSRPKYGDVLALAGGKQSTLLKGLNLPHGLAFKGDTLYVAEGDKVDSYVYAGGRTTGKQIVADGLPDAKSPELGGAYAHALKSVAIGQDGAIYVSIGSTGNVSEEDRDASPERASILRIPPGGGKPAIFARGVRNGTGLAVAPDGSVWTAVNNRDNIAYPYDGEDKGKVITSYVNEHPLEPLAKLTQGRELGWPYCNPDPDLKTNSYANRPFVRDIQMNPDGSKLDCAKLQPVEQGMGAHSAPLGLSFGEAGPLGAGALVGIHGSWNRQPPREPEVSFFAWRAGTLGPQQTILTGFQDGEGSRWGRPVAAVVGPDKALYVSDDKAGAIYRVTMS